MLDGCIEEHRKRIQTKGMWRQLTVPVTALDGMQGYIMTSASY